jgi:hypothetical protein
VIAFRGLVDVLLRRMIPWPSLFGTDETRLREDDVLARRRAWFWRKWIRRAVLLLAAFTIGYLVLAVARGFDDTSWVDTVSGFWTSAWGVLKSPAAWAYVLIFPVLFLFNFAILLLELALYTFKYIDVEQLLLFLPPFGTLDANGKPQQAKTVVYLERDDLKAALASPLEETLPGSPGQAIDARDRAAALSYIRPKLFTFEPSLAEQGTGEAA